MAEAEAEEVARQTRNTNNKENPQKKHCLGTIIEKNQLSSRYYKLNGFDWPAHHHFFYLLYQISKLELPGVMLKYEQSQYDR